MKTTEFKEKISQNVLDVSSYAQNLKIKKEIFSIPEDVLKILNWNFSDLWIEIKQKITCITNLYDELEYIKKLTEEKWFWYQDQNWNLNRKISNYKFEFSQKQLDQIKEITCLMKWFYQDRIRLLKTNNQVQNYFWWVFPDWYENLEIPLFTRLDLLENNDWNLSIAEIEPIYAWIWESLWTRKVFEEIWEKDNFFSSLQKNYLNAMKRFSWKNFLFFPNPLLAWYKKEIDYLFESVFDEADFCSLALSYEKKDLDFRSDGLYYNDKKVDILLNYFISKGTWGFWEFDEKILFLYKSWKLKLFPQASLILDSKLWSALIFDKKIFPKNYKLKKYFPKSRIVDKNTQAKENMLYKRWVSRVWKKDVIGFDGFIENKNQIQNDNVSWLEQEKINTKVREITVLSKKWKLEKQKMYSRIELYIFFTENWAEIWDVLITMSPKEIVKWWRDCVMLPAFSKL